MLLSRDQILAAKDMPFETVAVPEWGGDVRVAGLSVRARAEYEGGFTRQIRKKDGKLEYEQDGAGLMQIRERLVAFTVVDETGERLFTDADIAELGKKSFAALQRVFEVAQRLSGVTKQDVEELRGNSGETEEGDSSSVSPSASDAQ